MKKICPHCKIEKELELDFYKDKRHKTGRKSSCKRCHMLMGQKSQKNRNARLRETTQLMTALHGKNTKNWILPPTLSAESLIPTIQNLAITVNNLLDRVHRLEKEEYSEK